MNRYVLINWTDKTATIADGSTANAAARNAKGELGLTEPHPFDAAFLLLDIDCVQLDDEWQGKKDSTRNK